MSARQTVSTLQIAFSQCVLCARKQRGPTCEAFPNGIPDAILVGDHDHRSGFLGDRGLRFIPVRRVPSGIVTLNET